MWAEKRIYCIVLSCVGLKFVGVRLVLLNKIRLNWVVFVDEVWLSWVVMQVKFCAIDVD